MNNTTKIVYIEDGEVIATLGTICTSRSITVGEALEMLGLDNDEDLNNFFVNLGWDGYDYNCIDFAE